MKENKNIKGIRVENEINEKEINENNNNINNKNINNNDKNEINENDNNINNQNFNNNKSKINGNDNNINIVNYKILKTLEYHTSFINQILLLKDKRIASCSSNRSIIIYIKEDFTEKLKI